MRLINVIYDYEYDEDNNLIVNDDVDIISIPDKIADDLEEMVRLFFNWTSLEESGCWKLINGKKTCCVETTDFLRWLNINFFHYENKSSVLVEAHTNYRSDLPSAEF